MKQQPPFISTSLKVWLMDTMVSDFLKMRSRAKHVAPAAIYSVSSICSELPSPGSKRILSFNSPVRRFTSLGNKQTRGSFGVLRIPMVLGRGCSLIIFCVESELLNVLFAENIEIFLLYISEFFQVVHIYLSASFVLVYVKHITVRILAFRSLGKAVFILYKCF